MGFGESGKEMIFSLEQWLQIKLVIEREDVCFILEKKELRAGDVSITGVNT